MTTFDVSRIFIYILTRTQNASMGVSISPMMYSGHHTRESAEIQGLGIVWTRVEYEREEKVSPVQNREAKESWICVAAADEETRVVRWYPAWPLASIHLTRRVRKASLACE